MADQCFSMVRGRVMRATRLDETGAVASSGCSAITTEGFVSVAFTAVITETEAISVTNAGGKVCVSEPSKSNHTGYSMVITFCEVNPDLYAMVTGQETVYNSDGDAVGFRLSGDVDAMETGFALELWTGTGVAGTYGYVLVPFIQGGVLGDFTLENNAITFTIQGAQTQPGSQWGTGPYDVINGAGGIAGPLASAIGAKDFLHVQLTTIAPPEAGCACLASGPDPTGATAGTPGTWTPADAYPAADFAGLSGITASPTTAWTSGQYVVLEDDSNAYWNGTAWVAGIAP